MVADALSRLPAVAAVAAVAAVVTPASTGLLNWAQLATVQSTCEDLAALRARRPHHVVAVQVEGFPVWCDISTGVWRPVVPQGFRQQVFDTIHGLVHPGIRATTRLVSNRFLWPGLATDIKEWSRQCVACCRAKVTHVEHSGVEKIPIPGVHFSHVHVDLVGPIPASRDGSTYLLTMIDRSTRWPEAVPLSHIDVGTVLEAFITMWRSYWCCRQSYHQRGALMPRRRQLHLWMGQTGSTWLREGGPCSPWQTSTAAPTRCWSAATRRGRCMWAGEWRSSARTA